MIYVYMIYIYIYMSEKLEFPQNPVVHLHFSPLISTPVLDEAMLALDVA